MGSVHDAAGLRGIVRKEHQDIDAGVQQIFDLLELEVIVAIG